MGEDVESGSMGLDDGLLSASVQSSVSRGEFCLPAALLTERMPFLTRRLGLAASDSEPLFHPGGGPKVIMQNVELSTLAEWCVASFCPRDHPLPCICARSRAAVIQLSLSSAFTDTILFKPLPQVGDVAEIPEGHAVSRARA